MLRHKASVVSTILLTLLGIQGSIARPIQGLDRAHIQEEYDFIIAGGGTAGLVVANRLTESGKFRVLVLEAGPDPNVVAAYKPLGGNQLLAGTAIDWRFETTPQEHLDGRVLTYLRGRGLGGSSMINGFYYGRGTSTVYDRWEELGNPGWSWENVWPLFVKGTHFNPQDPSKAFDNTYKTWDPKGYSDGPLEIAYQGYVPATAIGFMHACEAANVPVIHDHNMGNSTGIKQGTATLDANLLRSSSYDGYLKKASHRENLDVLYYAPVMQLLTDSEGETPRVRGVQFMDHPTGRMYQVHAAKEVVVSLGAFQSPQLLMVSGYGPKDTLEYYGIEPIVVNENIGQQQEPPPSLPSSMLIIRRHNLDDHSVFSIMAKVDDEHSTSQYSVQFDLLAEAQEEFYSNGTGVYTAPSGITNGFQKLSEQELIDIGAEGVLEAGLSDQSHIEYLYESVWYPGGPTPYYTPLANESYISLTASSMVALSRGNVTIRGSSMAQAPVINPNYYANETDRAIAIQAFKYLRKILAHPELDKFTNGPHHGEVSPGPAVSDDDEDAIFEYIKANTIPNWHASATNRMLPLEDGGVVDPRLRVYGVGGLRVVDCSIIPVLPDVNIVGPVFMIGEKGAEMIRQDWGDV
ncbi:alcohol dehydrogenase [Sodiomyces alkalinus F11]|uniref:Alcohol dehydrogenase n=1 Tax=Sodiomyces alkalinus (strain CBS 110278 / VKM F-3762 / F11) TaxID=1314773 RepID=A0A3N2PZ31_SODAK|nr:alcohol dehydrogenase [Sodiomyces alkalinus F11]ROT39605.1 alcohol dehydrogenase [Sodiomyces alkalinus F11]